MTLLSLHLQKLHFAKEWVNCVDSHDLFFIIGGPQSYQSSSSSRTLEEARPRAKVGDGRRGGSPKVVVEDVGVIAMVGVDFDVKFVGSLHTSSNYHYKFAPERDSWKGDKLSMMLRFGSLRVQSLGDEIPLPPGFESALLRGTTSNVYFDGIVEGDSLKEKLDEKAGRNRRN
ncbi:unnamed protein product [Cylicocyclus nassatus]|uniref:Uncharacterized protein n=1 Tax=Cylicocyclus nassatus TaxID=53992 RepID=A0AA36M4V5_CYLNA|nr:unnamed protein product [Cylicocyclus nassatus]